MRNLPRQTQAILGLTFGLAAATAAVAIAWDPPVDHSAPWWLAFLLAAMLGEVLHVEGDEETGDGTSFTFSVAVLVAAAALFGPVPAALIAFSALFLVDLMRGDELERLTFNATTYGLAGFWASALFSVAGGRVEESISVLGPLVLMVGVHATITTVLIGCISGSARGVPLVRATVVYGKEALPPQVMEFSLGLVLARLADVAPLYAPLLVPLFIAVYRAHSRSVALHRETQHALRGLADMVDERDPYTRAHSERVGGYVAKLAESLGLPEERVRALSRAGRLHDLGKLVVDTAILMKPARLTDAEFEEMRSHPAASARLLSSFSFAREDARLVELHHERYDGRGYYHVPQAKLPLEAHFLILADSWDAMTSDRPYRRGMSRAAAIEQIRKNLGTQFHPHLGAAFIAMMEGRPAETELDPAQLRALRTSLSRDPKVRRYPQRLRRSLAGLVRRHRQRVLSAVGATALGLGVLFPLTALPAVAVAITAFSCAALRQLRVRRSISRTLAALARLDGGPVRVEALVDAVDTAFPMLWAGEITGGQRGVLHRRDLWTSSAASPHLPDRLDGALRKLGTSLQPNAPTQVSIGRHTLLLFPHDRGWAGFLAGDDHLPHQVVEALGRYVVHTTVAPLLVAVPPAAA